jgi:uncharacterized repeat protein (TIGR03803 family)
MKKVRGLTVRKTLTVATSRIPWQPLIGLVAAIVVMSVVVLSGQELKHVPPAAPSFIVLHSFAGGPTDGGAPYAGLIRDSAGNRYGTTQSGGASNAGVVFRLSPAGTETVLHSFTYSHSGEADGALPDAGLVRDGAGNLYGTTAAGGAACHYPGCGVVFKLSPTGTETVLYTFTGLADGAGPVGGLLRDTAGNLYGTTSEGGAKSSACSTQTCGVVFKLSPIGTYTVLHTFTGGADGANPTAGLILDTAGNLYGTTAKGGATSTCNLQNGCGVVFRLTP